MASQGRIGGDNPRERPLGKGGVAIYNRHHLPEVVIEVNTYGDSGSTPAGQDVVVVC